MRASLIAAALLLAGMALAAPARAADLPVCVEVRSVRAGDTTASALRDAMVEVFPGFDLRAVPHGCLPRVELVVWYAAERPIVDVRIDGQTRSLQLDDGFDITDLAVDVARLVDRWVRGERLPHERMAWRQRLRTIDGHVPARDRDLVVGAGVALGLADLGHAAAVPVLWPSFAVGGRFGATRRLSLQSDVTLSWRGAQRPGDMLSPRSDHVRTASLDAGILARIQLRTHSPRDRHLLVGPAAGCALWSARSERVFGVPVGWDAVDADAAPDPWLVGGSLGVGLELRPRSTLMGDVRRRELELRSTILVAPATTADWGVDVAMRWRLGAARAGSRRR